MKSRMKCAGAAITAILAWTSSASALSITLDTIAPVETGQLVAFHLSNVVDAKGALTFHWDFGDGVLADTTEPATTHVYKDPAHYNVFITATDAENNTALAPYLLTAHRPLTAAPPHNSTSILVDGDRRKVWNVNPDSNSVTVIDANSLERLRETPVGTEPHSLAQAPDGTIWVTNQLSDEITVLDRDTAEVLERIALPYASQPRALAFGPNGAAYVSLYATGKLVEVDGASRRVTRQADLGPTPAGVSVAADGRVFVTRFVSPMDHGEIWVLSPDTLAVRTTIVLPFDQSPDSAVGGRGVPNFVSSIAISPDGSQAWVSAKKDNVARGPQRDGLSMNSDNFVRSMVCAIDMRTEMEVLERRQDIDNRSMPVAVAFSPLGDYAYTLLMLNNEVRINDAYVATSNLGAISEAGKAPDGLAFSPDGRLFINSFLTREVIAYDLSASLESVNQTAPQPLKKIRATDRDPLSPEVLLGKQIFFDAMDPRMSAVGYMTCATCHFSGISDGRVWDFTDRGEGLRNTKSLLGVRGTREGRLHWSANMDEIQDFERDIRDSQGGDGFMPTGEYEARKNPASGIYDTFGKPAAGASPELDALAAYVSSLDKVPRSPYRNPDGSYTKDALAGRKVFERAGCPACHPGPDFTDSGPNPAGPVYNLDTILPTSGKRLGGPLLGIDTPSLKGVWQSAPYLHDGRAPTLLEVFTKYIGPDKMGKTSSLTDTELNQLVEYLKELDDVPETVAAAEGSSGGGVVHDSETTLSPAQSGRASCACKAVGNAGTGGPKVALSLLLAVVFAARRASAQPGSGFARRPVNRA